MTEEYGGNEQVILGSTPVLESRSPHLLHEALASIDLFRPRELSRQSEGDALDVTSDGAVRI